HQFFRPLRAEAGLPYGAPLHGVVLHPVTGERIEGPLDLEHGFEAAERIEESGGIVHVQGPTGERAAKRAADFAQKRERRSGRKIAFGDPEELRSEGPILVDQAKKRTEELDRLLPREAAKIAVEYVAHISSPDVALDPRLDEMRAAARDGAPAGLFAPEGQREILIVSVQLRHKTGVLNAEQDSSPNYSAC
ncbi:MAG TPA: hypothetical protein VFB61_15955, partial [Gemmatimonadales bacterium]|nr:hypothetical protein [Gemmatimonadales bacterium]